LGYTGFLSACKYVANADVVERGLAEGRLIGDIADELNEDPNQITKTIKFLRKTRGAEIPDGRTRLKLLAKDNHHPPSKDPPPTNEGGAENRAAS